MAVQLKKFEILLTVFLCTFLQIEGQCNVCSTATQIACVSETQYQICANNVATGSINSCPPDYICSTASTVTCQPRSSNIAPTCGSCNVCDATQTFACTGRNTYALCLGTNTPSTSAIGDCGPDLLCNINLPQMCGNATDGISPTCSSNDNNVNCCGSITISEYAKRYCQMLQINSRFPVPAEVDSTYQNYIYCFLTPSGTWSGQVYTCAGSTYFDQYSKYCVAKKPTEC
uniref:Chitin-binding type-2 domain-containing protein n=1 Tax=Musca domestica TaxID=7370 RepID=A0A1I8N8R1_MUSDO